MQAPSPQCEPGKRLKTPKEEDIGRFLEWLTANGAEVLATTNPFEVARWRSQRATFVIYRKASGKWTFAGESLIAWRAFREGRPMRFGKATRPHRQSDVTSRTLIERDGASCFYCDSEFGESRAPTVEHLVSRTHGGPNHVSNKFLACRECNRRAGHLSAPEKIRLREKLRAQAREEVSS